MGVMGSTVKVKVDVGGLITLEQLQIECIEPGSNGPSLCEGYEEHKRVWTDKGRAGVLEVYLKVADMEDTISRYVEVRVIIKSDQRWASTQRTEYQEGVRLNPQTHFVRARTDENWHKTNPDADPREE